MKTKKWVPVLIIVFAALSAYLAIFGYNGFVFGKEISFKGAPQMRFGIDIKGGIEAYFEPTDGYKPTPAELQAAQTVFESRLDSQNISDRYVSVDNSTGLILIRFPFESSEDASNANSTITNLGTTAKLEFKDPDGNVILTGSEVVEASPKFEDSKYVVGLKFNSAGTNAFADATSRLVGKTISINIDGKEISAPKVDEAITGGECIISSPNFTAATSTTLASQIKSGALPFNMKSSSYSIISPTLGQGSLGIMVNAGAVALFIIMLFMILYYKVPGFAACIGLIIQMALQIFVLSIPQFSLTLPGIAGIILSIGMGIDANIIIAERIKEEIRDGRTVSSSIEAGFHRAMAAIVDGNMTTLFAAVLLYFLTTGSMQSFGYTLFTGVVVNFFSSIVCVKSLTRFFGSFSSLRKPWLFGGKLEKKS